MKKLIFAFILLVGFLVSYFMSSGDVRERVVLSKNSQDIIYQQTKFDELGYAEKNIALNKASELDARKKEFNFDLPCSPKELFADGDYAKFAMYKKQAYSIFDEPEMRAKLDASQATIDKIHSELENMNNSNMDSKTAMISFDIENLVSTQNYFAQEILKKLPNNDLSYVIAQKTIEDTISNLVPMNILVFCNLNNTVGCESIKNKMKKAVDPESLLFANNIDKDIYFNRTDPYKNKQIDNMICQTDISVAKLSMQGRFSDLYKQEINDNVNSSKVSPFAL